MIHEADLARDIEFLHTNCQYISLLVTCALLTKVSSSLLYSMAEPNDAWNSEMTGSTNFLADLYFSCTIFIIPLFRTKPNHWNKSHGNIVHFQSKKVKSINFVHNYVGISSLSSEMPWKEFYRMLFASKKPTWIKRRQSHLLRRKPNNQNVTFTIIIF